MLFMYYPQPFIYCWRPGNFGMINLLFFSVDTTTKQHYMLTIVTAVQIVIVNGIRDCQQQKRLWIIRGNFNGG